MRLERESFQALNMTTRPRGFSTWSLPSALKCQRRSRGNASPPRLSKTRRSQTESPESSSLPVVHFLHSTCTDFAVPLIDGKNPQLQWAPTVYSECVAESGDTVWGKSRFCVLVLAHSSDSPWLILPTAPPLVSLGSCQRQGRPGELQILNQSLSTHSKAAR